MSRKRPGRARFPYKITILERPDASQPVEQACRRGEIAWQRKALHDSRMRFWIQAQKATARSRLGWTAFGVGLRYGAPGPGEYICRSSGLVCRQSARNEAIYFRRYWALCAKKAYEILYWLEGVKPEEYTQELHHLLTRLVVIEYNQREIQSYEREFGGSAKEDKVSREGCSVGQAGFHDNANGGETCAMSTVAHERRIVG